MSGPGLGQDGVTTVAGIQRLWCQPAVLAVVCLIIGLLLGWFVTESVGPASSRGYEVGAAMSGCFVLLIGAGVSWWRDRIIWLRLAVVLAMICLGASWWVYQTQRMQRWTLAKVVSHESQLVVVEGEVVRGPRTRVIPPGALGDRGFLSPTTTMVVAVDRLMDQAGQAHPVSGSLLTMLPTTDGRWREGQRVRMTGWLSGFAQPANPGEQDFAEVMLERGIVGRLALSHPGNLELLSEPTGLVSQYRSYKSLLSELAADALYVGVPPNADRSALSLLDAMLLGERRDNLAEVQDTFRKTGLGHLLAISGLHLGVLAAGIWMVMLLVTGRPRLALIVTLAAIAIYALLIPARVPITRATLMALAIGTAMLGGRAVQVGPVLALVAIGLLVWRPLDLLTPGFQLSFGVVAALLLFVRPVSYRLIRPSEAELNGLTDSPWSRRLADFIAVTLVAWATTLPIIAYHFQLVSPLGWLFTLIALPVVAVMLWLGFLKMIISLLLPQVGSYLAWPLLWLAELLVRGSFEAERMPLAYHYLPQPSLVWTLVAMTVIVAILSGRFQRRVIPLLLATGLCVAWLLWPS